uniref:Uncharacterized protein n=1 Tax=Anopheles culicifacies TaxID=139723 RepID=A0A182LZV7_9DIPT
MEEEQTVHWIDLDDGINIQQFDNIDDEDTGAETLELDNAQEIPDEAEPFMEKIRKWALKTYQTHQAINSLLAILRAHTNHKLPKDARTLLRTNRNGNEIMPIPGGEFWYPGIQSALNNHFRDVQPRVSSFSLNFSVDGLPLHKSTRKQF